MKILHVITTLDVGGAEMHLLAQVRGQCARGHVVQVRYLKGQGTLGADFRDAGAQVAGLGGSVGALAGLWREIGRHEIVHSHLLKADMLCALVALFRGRTRHLIASKHNDEQVLKRPLVSWIHGLLGNLPRRTIVLSEHVGRFIERYGRVRAERLTRIYYGLDVSPFVQARTQAGQAGPVVRQALGVPPGAIVFICVARFAPQKAHDVLLRAFAQARAQEKEQDLRLVLVGDDPFGDGRTRAMELARELGLLESGAVLFTGIRRDVPRLMAAADVFVMSSLWEGLGLVFLEAMATRLPVLSTDVSAIPEVVLQGETGVLVPPGQVAPLASAMQALANSAPLRERMGQAGERRVHEHFGLDSMIEATLAVYRGAEQHPSAQSNIRP